MARCSLTLYRCMVLSFREGPSVKQGAASSVPRSPRGEGLEALRRSLRVRPADAVVASRRWLSTGIDEIDAILGGGLLCGRLMEIVGPPSSGRTALLLCALAAATARGEVVAWIDPACALDVRALDRAGVVLPRVLWVRPHSLRQALAAAEVVLGTDGFALVVLDLGDAEAVHLPDGAWARLSRAAERAGAAVVLLAEAHLSGTFAAVTLQLEPVARAWCGVSPRHTVLTGTLAQARVVRSKVGPPERTALLRLGHGAGPDGDFARLRDHQEAR